MNNLNLPDYKDQSPDVQERFSEIYKRPVILNIHNLTRTFNSNKGTITALKRVNFLAHRREFICVIGASGCGKSTLIRILAGLVEPSEGSALLDGSPISGPGPDRGMVFQEYTLFPWLTVKRNVMFGLQMAGHTFHHAEQEALQWIELVGLHKFAEHYPHQLSGGMKQRVAIARSLANKPRILLMDEPFGALDAQTRAHMQAHLLQIWRSLDVTVFFITHDLDEAVYLSDRILVLKPHPGEVLEIVENPVPRPRNPDQLITPEFLATKKHLENLIHPPQPEEKEEQIPLSTVRMTQVGDDPE